MANFASALKYLKDNPVKRGDSPESAARSERMNAITDAILSLARGEHIRRGPGIRIKNSEGLVTISGTGAEDSGGGGDLHPFELYDATPNPALGVTPGRVCQLVAKIGTALLTDDPPPVVNIPVDELSIYVKVSVDQTDEDNNHRSGVADAVIVTDNEVGAVDELKMIWDNGPHSIGHFYVKIGDVSNVAPPAAPSDPPVLTFVQLLRNNIETIVVAGDDAIILVAS